MLMNIAFKAEKHWREFEMLKTWDTHTHWKEWFAFLPLSTIGWFSPQLSYKLVLSSSLFFQENSRRVSVFPHTGSLFLASGCRRALAHSSLAFLPHPLQEANLSKRVCLMSPERNWLHSKLFVPQYRRGHALGHSGDGTCCPCLRPVAHRANRTVASQAG